METCEDFCNTVCRVCLNSTNITNMVSLINTTNKNELSCYGKAVKTFANIRLENDYLPNKMCRKCLSMLKQAILFKKSCENNQRILENLIVNCQSSKSKVMEKISDYLIFRQIFPEKCAANRARPCKLKSTSNKKAKTSISKENKQAQPSYMFQGNEVPFPSDDEDEMLLNRIEIMIGENPKQLVPSVGTGKVKFNGKNPEQIDDIEELLKINANSKLSLEMDDKSLPQSVSEVVDDTELTFNADQQNTSNNELEKDSSDGDTLLDTLEQTLNSVSNNIKYAPQKKKENTKIKMVKYKYLKSKQGARRHAKRNVQCEVCNKMLANRSSYSSHMQRHKGFRFVCEHCANCYVTLPELRYHLASTHDIGPCYVCNKCGFKTFRKFDFKEHDRFHTGERPYTCDKCGLTFRRRFVWKKHAIYHMEKTVPCPHCQKKFHRPQEMRAHMNNVHERLYVYQCSECDVTYAKTCTVRRHLVDKHGIAREMQGKITRVIIGKASVIK